MCTCVSTCCWPYERKTYPTNLGEHPPLGVPTLCCLRPVGHACGQLRLGKANRLRRLGAEQLPSQSQVVARVLPVLPKHHLPTGRVRISVFCRSRTSNKTADIVSRRGKQATNIAFTAKKTDEEADSKKMVAPKKGGGRLGHQQPVAHAYAIFFTYSGIRDGPGRNS